MKCLKTLKNLILSLCGHPCLRVWVGGFRPDLAMDNFCPTLYFVPPKICPGKGGLWENSPAGKHSLLFIFLNHDEQCCQNGLLPKLFLQPFGHAGSTDFDPRPLRSKGEQNKPAIVPSVSNFISTMFGHSSFIFSDVGSAVYVKLDVWGFPFRFGVFGVFNIGVT